MDDPKPLAEMTDEELVAEWECIDCESVEDSARSCALAAELEARNVDF